MERKRKVEDPEIRAMRIVSKALGRIDRAFDAATSEVAAAIEGLPTGARLRLLGFAHDQIVRSVKKLTAPFGAAPLGRTKITDEAVVTDSTDPNIGTRLDALETEARG